MSQENVEIVAERDRRWNAGERGFPDEEIHPEVVVVSRGVLDTSVRGRAGLRRYLREIDEQFDEWTSVMEIGTTGRFRRGAGPRPSPRQAKRRGVRSTSRVSL